MSLALPAFAPFPKHGIFSVAVRFLAVTDIIHILIVQVILACSTTFLCHNLFLSSRSRLVCFLHFYTFPHTMRGPAFGTSRISTVPTFSFFHPLVKRQSLITHTVRDIHEVVPGMAWHFPAAAFSSVCKFLLFCDDIHGIYRFSFPVRIFP